MSRFTNLLRPRRRLPAAGIGQRWANDAWLLNSSYAISLADDVPAAMGRSSVPARQIGTGVSPGRMPGQAALPFLAGALLNVYSGLAAAAQLDFTGRELTIFA